MENEAKSAERFKNVLRLLMWGDFFIGQFLGKRVENRKPQNASVMKLG